MRSPLHAGVHVSLCAHACLRVHVCERPCAVACVCAHAHLCIEASAFECACVREVLPACACGTLCAHTCACACVCLLRTRVRRKAFMCASACTYARMFVIAVACLCVRVRINAYVCVCASVGFASCSYLNRTCLLMRQTVRVRTRQNGHACVDVRGRLKVCKTMCVHGCVFGILSTCGQVCEPMNERVCRWHR